MRGGQTQGPMRTGRSCMREDGRSSGLSLWMLAGKSITKSGPRDQQRNSPSGLVRDPVRRLVNQNLLKEKMMRVLHQLAMKMRKKRKKKRRRKKRNKQTTLTNLKLSHKRTLAR